MQIGNKNKSKIRISHFVGLSGVGGVQKNFSDYMKLEVGENFECIHTVYTLGEVDCQYRFSKKILNILKIRNFLRLILDLVSNNVIVHFYNNLTSLKVAFFLLPLPVKKLIVHERGSAWNLHSKYRFILKFIVWKSNLVLANSEATKTLLQEKFYIDKDKVKVVYNGVDTSFNCIRRVKTTGKCFYIGFIGRIDSPKGVHVLIDSMYQLIGHNIKLIIAGDGPLKKKLIKKSNNLNNIEFIGRVDNPYSFFNKIDLLVVPSIREPLGNVCLEAGLCKVPVLASRIDGIPEIIEDKISGELIEPIRKVEVFNCDKVIPLPEWVVNPINKKLIKPKQIDSFELSGKILSLSNRSDLLLKYSNNLHDKICKNFGMDKYANQMRKIYTELSE